ncbi:MAG: hypothetical protein AABX99_01345 [Nanoarchaeota archaeon]
MKNIFIDAKGKKLEALSEGDVLLFPCCREEKVLEVSLLFRELYVQRTRDKDNKKFPKIVYELNSSGEITSNSVGRIYEYGKELN